MIKVNLLRRPKKSGGLALKLPAAFRFGEGDAQSRNKLRQLVVVVLFCALIQYLWVDYQDSEVKKVEAQLEKTNQELATVRQQLAKSQELETIKAQLEGDEKTLKTKLDTLTKLMSERATSFKALKSVSLLLPKEIWVKKVELKDATFVVEGGAVDYNNVSDFIKTLQESGSFSSVSPKFQKQERLHEVGSNFVAFQLEFQRK